jgi:hypothetical protein
MSEEEQKRRRSASRRNRSSKRRHEEPLDVDLVSLENFPHRSENLNLTDAKHVCLQLGYVPSNIIEVAAKNSAGQPMVALLYGLTNLVENDSSMTADPFPTIYWLTSPDLSRAISALETEGWIDKFQRRLDESESHANRMYLAHTSYSEQRRTMLSSGHRQLVQDNGWDFYDTVGIAGMKNYRAVKCLHCHVAHFLGAPQHGNIIGEWVMTELLTLFR